MPPFFPMTEELEKQLRLKFIHVQNKKLHSVSTVIYQHASKYFKPENAQRIAAYGIPATLAMAFVLARLLILKKFIIPSKNFAQKMFAYGGYNDGPIKRPPKWKKRGDEFWFLPHHSNRTFNMDSLPHFISDMRRLKSISLQFNRYERGYYVFTIIQTKDQVSID